MDNVYRVIQKGLAIMETLQQMGQSIAPAVKAINDVVTKAKAGGITDADLDDTEAILDQLIADFNEPIPE